MFTPAPALLALNGWLHRNDTTARKLTAAVQRAVHWMREHSAQEIRSRMPAQYRAPDASADLEALQAMVGMLSPDGRMPPVGAQAVRKVLAVSSEKVGTAPIDVAKIYTNEFVAPRQ